MNCSCIALFPGQGSQSVGMGAEFLQEFPLAKQLFAEADQALGFSLSSICLAGPIEKLTSTEHAQPAILCVSVIAFRLAQQLLGSQLTIQAAAGHSLGEYSALVCAGSLDFGQALQLVHKRGQYMQQAVPAGAGKMLAVLGEELATIEAACTQVKSGVAEIANINAPGQIVVAGDVGGMQGFIEQLPKAKVKELPVSAPFHCSMMKPAEDKLRKELAALRIQAPSFPVFANVTGVPAKNPEEIRELLARQVCGRVRWVECMHNAAAQSQTTTAIEFGSGAVLSGLLKRIDPKLTRKNVGSPKDLSELQAWVSKAE
jgi:[acyl-carrier-protein] S-malonyltransferase